LRINPDTAPIAFDDLLTNRQADTGTAVSAVSPVEAFEQTEDLFLILRFDADSIILNAEVPE
jgi:hypothetical protein